jgi:hypothetical protein
MRFDTGFGVARKVVIEMPETVFENIVGLGQKRLRGVHLRPPCSEAAIRQLQTDAERDLSEEVPRSFIALLRLTNGLQINCAYFKEAEHVVLDNLDVFEEDVIFLGNDSLAQYVFDKRDKKFHTINMGFPDERFASYETFEEMLAAILKEQQVV